MGTANNHSAEMLDSDHAPIDGAPHITMKGYAIGFGLSVLLTAIPFALVMIGGIASPSTIGFIVLAFAVVQIVVHMVYFLHLDAKSEGGWNMLALIFTVVLLVILVTGSMWVMYHMNTNMMPAPPQTQP